MLDDCVGSTLVLMTWGSGVANSVEVRIRLRNVVVACVVLITVLTLDIKVYWNGLMDLLLPCYVYLGVDGSTDVVCLLFSNLTDRRLLWICRYTPSVTPVPTLVSIRFSGPRA